MKLGIIAHAILNTVEHALENNSIIIIIIIYNQCITPNHIIPWNRCSLCTTTLNLM